MFKYRMIEGLTPAPPLLEGRSAVPPNPPHKSGICWAVMVGFWAGVWLVVRFGGMGMLDGQK